MNAFLRLPIWIITVIGSLSVLNGPLARALPAPQHLNGWPKFVSSTDTGVVAMTAIRLGAVSLAWYLAVITVIAITASAVGLGRHIERFVPRVVRLAVSPIAIIAVGLLGANPAAGASPVDPPVATMHLVPAPTALHREPGAPTVYVVQPGDSFWSIATEHGGELPGYWLELIAANRDRVSDPNLIFPGQEVVLP